MYVCMHACMHACMYLCMYVAILQYITIFTQDLNSKRLLGGELAMWSDHYCETRQCWDEPNWQRRGNAPVAYWMYKLEYDKEFSESMMGMVNTVAK